jgi:hypothetical protein
MTQNPNTNNSSNAPPQAGAYTLYESSLEGVVNVKGQCNVGVETKRGLKKIREVLFVPKLDQNLLSIGQLMEHDYALYFEGRTCTIYDEGREKLVMAEVKMAHVKICRGKEMEATASLYYSSLFDLIQTTKYIG